MKNSIPTTLLAAACLAFLAPAGASAEASEKACAVVVSAPPTIKAAALKTLRFKVGVILRNHGLQPIPEKSLADDLPEASDPWLAECLQSEKCLPGLTKQLDAEALLLITITRAGRNFSATVRLWSLSAESQSAEVSGSSLADLQAGILGSLSSAESAVFNSMKPANQAKPVAGPATPAGATPVAEQHQPSPAQDAAISGSTNVPAGPTAPEPVKNVVPATAAPPAPETAQSVPQNQPAPEQSHEPCIDVFQPAQPKSADEAETTAVFIKPKVLLLPIVGLDRAQTRNRRVFANLVATALASKLKLERIDWIEHCSRAGRFDDEGHSIEQRALTRAALASTPIHGVEWVFEVALKKWGEKKDGQQQYEIESEFGINMLKVVDGKLTLEKDEFETVPTMLDKLVFSAQDAAHHAKQAAMNTVANAVSTGSQLATSVSKAANAARVVAGEASRLDGKAGAVAGKISDIIGKSPEDQEYEYKLAQNLEMAGDKLALDVKKHPRFRLSSPVVSRNGSEAGIAVGLSEGVKLNETYLFYMDDPASWDGFGRVADVGLGGTQGRANPSFLTVISDYDTMAGTPQAIEYPLIGIQLGVFSGLMPIKHNQTYLAVNQQIGQAGVGMPGLGLDVRFRIPWLPITELYETNQVAYVFDQPLQVVDASFGLEKRWTWHRWMPELGVRYNFVSLSVPVPDPADSTKQQSASASASGLEGYVGMGLFLHPVLTVHLLAGYRYFFRRVNQFSYNNQTYYAHDEYGNTWDVDLSGLLAKVMVSYEF